MSSLQTRIIHLISGIRSRIADEGPFYDRSDLNDRELPKRASADMIQAAEQQLGFEIPAMLKACLQQVANGGFGPGYGLIGLEGGHLDSFDRSLIQAVHHLSDFGLTGNNGRWERLIPVWEWGAGITICVQGNDTDESLYVVDERGLTRSPISFGDAIWNWIKHTNSDDLMFQFKKVFRPNPFGGPPIEVKGARMAKGDLVGWFSVQ